MKMDEKNITDFTEEIDSWLFYCKMRSTEVLPAEMSECKGITSTALWNILQTIKELREYAKNPLYSKLPLTHKEQISEIDYAMTYYLNAYPLQNLNKIKHPLDSEYSPDPLPKSKKEEMKMCGEKKKRIEEQLKMSLTDLNLFKCCPHFSLEDLEAIERWEIFIYDTLTAVEKFKGQTLRECKQFYDTIYREGFSLLTEANQKAFWQEMFVDFDHYYDWVKFAEKAKIDKLTLSFGYDNMCKYLKETLEDMMPLSLEGSFKADYESRLEFCESFFLRK